MKNTVDIADTFDEPEGKWFDFKIPVKNMKNAYEFTARLYVLNPSDELLQKYSKKKDYKKYYERMLYKIEMFGMICDTPYTRQQALLQVIQYMNEYPEKQKEVFDFHKSLLTASD